MHRHLRMPSMNNDQSTLSEVVVGNAWVRHWVSKYENVVSNIETECLKWFYRWLHFICSLFIHLFRIICQFHHTLSTDVEGIGCYVFPHILCLVRWTKCIFILKVHLFTTIEATGVANDVHEVLIFAQISNTVRIGLDLDGLSQAAAEVVFPKNSMLAIRVLVRSCTYLQCNKQASHHRSRLFLALKPHQLKCQLVLVYSLKHVHL